LFQDTFSQATDVRGAKILDKELQRTQIARSGLIQLAY